MKNTHKALTNILNTKPKLIGASLLSLVLAYVLASFAVDSGSLWVWVGAIIAFVYCVIFLVRTFRKIND